MVRWIRVAALSWWLAALLGTASALAQSEAIVREVVIDGAQRIEPETVRSYLLIQEGDVADAGRIDRSLKSLFATGLFADVTIRRDGAKLIVHVVENPVINRVAFEGNRRIKDDDLKAEASLQPRIIYTRAKLQNDVNRILNLYRRSGRFAATVEPKIIELPQNRVDLVYEITEGDLTEIASIRFVGNRQIGDSKLREVIRTKETRWYRFFSSDDTYDPDRLTLDRELLRRYYLKSGFADFRVQSAIAELTPDRKHFFITFTLDEGSRYRYGKVDVEARLRDLKAEDVRPAIDMEAGDWYNADEIDSTADTITDKVSAMGYAFVDVRPRIDRDRETKTINVTYEVKEGPRVFVDRIDVTGNVRTLDKVVRREFRLVEGDAFSASKLRRSNRRLQNLGFFEKVKVEQVPGSAADKTVVKVDVQEKATGSLSIGVGYSTNNGALVETSIRERNLLGRGQDLGLKATLSERRSQFDLNFTEPYFLDRDVAAGFDLFNSKIDLQRSSSYDAKILGGALRASYPITEDLRQGWKYTAKSTSVANVQDNASRFIKDQEGTRLLSEVSHFLMYDRRDNRLNPTEGYFVRWSTDVAGAGGATRNMRNRIDGGEYFTVKEDWVLGLTASTGYVFGLGQDVRLTDRFFVGGDNLRGFATAGIGPRDRVTEDALGGEWMYTASAELSFPVGLPTELGVKGKLFTDLGSSGKLVPTGPEVQDTGSVRASVGTGLAWVSPLGVIGVDLGIPVIKESFDQVENFRLNFGTKF